MKKVLLQITGLIVLMLVGGAVNSELMAQQESSSPVLVSNKGTNDGRQGAKMVSLADLLTTVEQNFEATFLFKDEMVYQKRVNADKIQMGENTGQQLAAILDQLGLTYYQVDEQTYVLLPKKNLFKKVAMQEQITGTVTDAGTGEPLPGVNILVKGTSTGTSTGSEGTFELTVESLQDTLVVTYVGYQRQEVPIQGRTEIDIALQSQAITGEEMVVTALGVEREEKSLGYSVTEVPSKDLSKSIEPNMGNLLQGKVAGVSVSPSSGGAGSSTRITIRGASSLAGSNQPLYVLDGMPIDNSNIGSAGKYGGIDGGDGISDIDPENIESMNVLKGAAAAALYGSRARNGVIIINTKSGAEQSELNVHLSSNTTIKKAVDFSNYQTTYGQGIAGTKPQTQQVALETGDKSFGAPLDGSSVIQFDGVKRPYEYVGNRTFELYRTAILTKNTLTLSEGTKDLSYHLSGSLLNSPSIMPNSNLKRQSLTLRSRATPGNLKVDVQANYINSATKNRPTIGDISSNATQAPRMLAPNISMKTLQKNYITEEGTEQTPNGYIYFANPYWVFNKKYNKDDKDRLIGTIKLAYDFTDWLTLTGRTGLDWYTLDRKAYDAAGTAYNLPGDLSQNEYRVSENNTNIFLSLSKQLISSLSVNAILGGSSRNNKYEQVGHSGSDYKIPGFNTISNMKNIEGSYNYSAKQVNSLYGSVDFGYNDYLFLTVTGRNDWSSTLPVNNNSFFYPSVSGSLVFTDVLAEMMPDWLSYGKLRASWAEVGYDTDPYQLRNGYNLASQNYQGQSVGYIGGNSIPISDLKPTSTKEVEVGLNLGFLNGRSGIDITWYNKKTSNQILSTSVSTTTGYSNQIINAGKIKNRGIELLLTGVPIRTGSLSWNSSLNWSRNWSKVLELGGNLNILELAESRTETASITAQAGEPYGTIYGYAFKRDEDGNLINKNGFPQRAPEKRILGKQNPDWNLGWSNTIAYQNITLSALIDARWGGQMFSGTESKAVAAGRSKRTLKGRSQCDEVSGGGRYSDSGCFIGPGVMQVGTDNEGNPVYEPNDVKVTPKDYYEELGYHGVAGEYYVFDNNFIKLRNLQLSYNLPTEWLGNGTFQSVTISIVGRDLFYLYKTVPNVDPESTQNRGNAQGLEYLSLPGTRKIGLRIDVEL